MRRSRERDLDAYLDGALSEVAARRVEQRLASDPEAQRHLAGRQALSALTREAWCEGPAAPAPEYLIAALRPAMSGVDVELEQERAPRWPGLRGWLGPVPAAGLGVAAVALALAVLPARDPGSQPRASAPLALAADAPPAGLARTATVDPALEAEAVFGVPSTVYDLALGEDSPVMVFGTEDGSTVIWLIEEEDSVSLAPGAGGWV